MESIKYHISQAQLSSPYETSHRSYMKQNHVLNPNKCVDKISQPRSISISGCVRNHEVQLQGQRISITRTSHLQPPQFSSVCGTVYQQGNILYTPDGYTLLSPVGNRVSAFDLVK